MKITQIAVVVFIQCFPKIEEAGYIKVIFVSPIFEFFFQHSTTNDCRSFMTLELYSFDIRNLYLRVVSCEWQFLELL